MRNFTTIEGGVISAVQNPLFDIPQFVLHPTWFDGTQL
jgi:hypothetical protein